MSFVEVLRQIASRLEACDIPYMVTGSIAASYYGLARATYDLDIVISATPEKLKSLIQLLPKEDYYAVLMDSGTRPDRPVAPGPPTRGHR